jgi:hypothetical protein
LVKLFQHAGDATVEPLLAAAKARGTLLGSARPDHWKGREDARLQGLANARGKSKLAKREKVLAAVADLLPDMQKRRQAGESLAMVATALNDAGQRTTRGNRWTPTVTAAYSNHRRDLYALRHTFISNLAAGGVHPKTAQGLARHSTITLTMDGTRTPTGANWPTP